MAETGLPTNQLFEFLSLLLRKRWSVIIPALAGLAISLVVLCFLPKRFEAWTKVEVREVRLEEDPIFRNPQTSPYKDLQNVQSKILNDGSLSKALIDMLQWVDFLVIQNSPARRKKFLDDVIDRTKIERAKKDGNQGNDYITITFKDEDPKRASSFVKAIRDIWMEDTVETQFKQVEGELLEQQRQYDKLSTRLSRVRTQVKQWQEEHKLSPTLSNSQRSLIDEDWVTREWNQARVDLSRTDTEVKISEEHYKKASLRQAEEPPLIAVDVSTPGVEAKGSLGNDLAKPMQEQINKLENEIRELNKEIAGKTKRHWLYSTNKKLVAENETKIKSIKDEMLKSGIIQAVDKPQKFILNPDRIRLKQEADRAKEEWDTKKSLREQLAAHLKDMDDLHKKRPQVYETYRMLETDEDLAKKQYQEAAEGTDKKKLVLQRIKSASGNPYRILVEPVAADTPVEPKVPLVIGIGLLLGAGIGLGWVFLREFVRPSFRSMEDVSASLSLPVLGVVNRMLTVREIRRARWRGIIGIGASLAAIFILAGAAGIYLVKPKLLPSPVLQAIDSLKQQFR